MKTGGIFVLGALLLISGCTSTYISEDHELKEMIGQTYYTTCDLHADPANGHLYSVNYQIAGSLIPWGTELTIDSASGKKVVFADDKGKRIPYFIHDRTRGATSLSAHLKRFLSKDISALKRKVTAMSSIDKDGIKAGMILPGMTKEAVLVAAGYPPEFVCKDPMESDVWTYWRNRFVTFNVFFDKNGKVKSVK